MPAIHALATLLVSASLFAVTLRSQGSWSRPPVTGTAPLRAHHAAVYDLVGERLISFGGFNPSYTPQSSTLEFDGVQWSQITTPAPPARVGHAMAYDIARDRVVLFGGLPTMLSQPLSDTWEFDGATWSQRFPDNSPERRVDHAMAYDVVSHGTLLVGGRIGTTMQGSDTWIWDGVDWAPIASAGPPPRFGHAMSCDWNRGRTVLFGGSNNGVLGDTWEWDGSSWSSVAAVPAPAARTGHGMAFDFARGITVLHGGSPNGAQTWEWDGTSWTQQGSTIEAVIDHVLVYDARLQRTTLFGGTIGAPPQFNTEVEAYGLPIPGVFELRGTSCVGSVGTAHLLGVASGPGPAIGETPVVQIRETWFHSFFLFGWSDTHDGGTPLPHDLGAYGMPGCSLQVSRDATASVAPVNGTATMPMSIPNDPFLVGHTYFVQGLTLDTAANAAGLTTTNRVMVTLGRN